MGTKTLKHLTVVGLVCVSAACTSGGEDATAGTENAGTPQVDTTATSPLTPSTESVPIDAGSGTIEVAGQVDGVSVMASAASFRAFCDEPYDGSDERWVVAHHIRWQGRGADVLEGLGVMANDALATGGTTSIWLSVLGDARFTGDLDRPLADYPALTRFVQQDELDYDAVRFAAQPNSNLDAPQAVHLDLDLTDRGDPAGSVRVTADFGCHEEAVLQAQAGPSAGA